jgi:type I restriction enzyme R subunit
MRLRWLLGVLAGATVTLLQGQAYYYLRIISEAQLVANVRPQLELRNGITFTDS